LTNSVVQVPSFMSASPTAAALCYPANEILLTQRNELTRKHLPQYSQPHRRLSTLQDTSPERNQFLVYWCTETDTQTDRNTHWKQYQVLLPHPVVKYLFSR